MKIFTLMLGFTSIVLAQEKTVPAKNKPINKGEKTELQIKKAPEQLAKEKKIAEYEAMSTEELKKLMEPLDKELEREGITFDEEDIIYAQLDLIQPIYSKKLGEDLLKGKKELANAEKDLLKSEKELVNAEKDLLESEKELVNVKKEAKEAKEILKMTNILATAVEKASKAKEDKSKK